MKKFYYKKDLSLDKSPIVQQLERRHTLDIDKNERDPDQSRITTRTKSVSSVHLLEDEPATSIAKAREITKSLSEDVLSKGYIKKSAKVITEMDLVSSGLYKARKASMNSKDTPQKVPQPTGLSPIALTDPKLKPIPVKSRARSKKSRTCLCYFAITMAISLCTIGVLAAVTGILYNEIISSENSTSAESSDSNIDYTNLIPLFRSLNDNYSETDGMNFNSETVHTSVENTGNTTIASENETLTLHEHRSKENVQMMGDGQFMNVTDLKQLLDSEKAGIKFKDGDTIIYELISNSSSKLAKISKNLEIKEVDSNESETEAIKEPSTSNGTNTWSDKVNNEKIEVLENNEDIDSLSKLKDIFTDIEQHQHLPDENSNTEVLGDLVNSSLNVTFENEIILGSVREGNKSELFNSEKPQSLSKANVGEVYDNQNRSIFPEQSDNNEGIFESNDLSIFAMDKQKPKTETYEVETFQALKNANTKFLTNKSEHDVDSMLMIINDEDDEEASNTVLSRNGEINPLFENSRLFESKNGFNNPVVQLATQRSQEQQMSEQEAQHTKPMDMKVSLAEAMKHLQVLDANNTFLTSRMKSVMPKPQNTGQTKITENSLNKQNITIENMKYLQKLRLLLQQNLLRN